MQNGARNLASGMNGLQEFVKALRLTAFSGVGEVCPLAGMDSLCSPISSAGADAVDRSRRFSGGLRSVTGGQSNPHERELALAFYLRGGVMASWSCWQSWADRRDPWRA